MNERTRYESERGQGEGRRLANVTARIAQWAQRVAPGAVNGAWQLIGTLNDAIRAGQYDLGMPFIYSRTIEVTSGESTPLIVPVKKYGVIQTFVPVVTNITDPRADLRIEAGITRIEIGAQTFYEAQEGTLFRPTDVFSTGFANIGHGTALPEDYFGFLRRIPVAQGDVINVTFRNFGADTYQCGLVVVQYGMLPPALVNAG